jgi:hypothetical protein
MRTLLAIGLCATLSSVATADIISAAPDAVEVTIYRGGSANTADVSDMNEPANGIAMISETRILELPAGTSTITFRGVAETIVSQSAKLESLPGEIVETNFDYSLIGPGELIAKSIGRSVRVVRTDFNTGRVTEQRAVLRSGPDGVLLDIDGKIEALDCSGAHEKIVFDSVPSELTDKPTLSAAVRVLRSGRYDLRLTYLATGLDWSADYVAKLNTESTLELSGWITLANKQSTSFIDAPIQVIAGDISRDPDTTPIETTFTEQKAACWPTGKFYSILQPKASAPIMRRSESLQDVALGISVTSLQESIVTGSYIAGQRDFGDYKLYQLPMPTTVAARQFKQVRMLDQRQVPFKRLYARVLDMDDIDTSDGPMYLRPFTVLRLQNKKQEGLGKPLPAGTISVMESSNTNRWVLAGEHAIRDTPIGLPVDIELGEAMDIDIHPRVVSEGRCGLPFLKSGCTELDIEVTNRKGVDITVELSQRFDAEKAPAITKESIRHTMKNGLPTWALRIKSGQSATLKYTLRALDDAPAGIQ